MNSSAQPTNIFAMFQKNPNCHYPCVRIDFTQIKDNTESTVKGEDVFKKIIPTYNKDGLYYTDAFIVESEIIRKESPNTNCSQPSSANLTKEKFQSRIQKLSEGMDLEEYEAAEPQSSFCQICRAPYESYHGHIEQRDHIRNLEFSKGYKYIKQICKQAKKHLQPDCKDQKWVQVKGAKKSKSMIVKKVTGEKGKKQRKSSYKMRGTDCKLANIETIYSEQVQPKDLKIEKQDKFVSIINSQINEGTVEKIQIQNIK